MNQEGTTRKLLAATLVAALVSVVLLVATLALMRQLVDFASVMIDAMRAAETYGAKGLTLYAQGAAWLVAGLVWMSVLRVWMRYLSRGIAPS